MDDLVRRLSEEQAVELDLRPENSLKELVDAVARGYVHVRFPKTGTTLGVAIDPGESRLDAARAGAGTIVVAGELTLNFERVYLRSEVDVASFKGTGRLEHRATVDPWAADDA